MPKIIAGLFTSVDGVVEAPNAWHFPYLDDEVGAVVASNMRPRMLLGRRTYEEFRDAFAPQAGQEFADRMAAPRKLVVSSTLQDADWGNATVLGADWIDTVRRERAGSGSDLSVTGSLQLIRSLISNGLLDELHLVVHPVVVGKGSRLFPAEGATFPLPLVSAKALSRGSMHVIYAPATGER